MSDTSPHLPLRWSSLYKFMKCQRSYKLAYLDGLQKRAGTDSRARLLGSTVHAGLQDALHVSWGLGDLVDDDVLVAAASTAVRRYIDGLRDPSRTVWDNEQRRRVPDEAYDRMLNDILVQALQIVHYQVPRIGLGTRYRVASVGEALGRDENFCYVCEQHGYIEAGRCGNCGHDTDHGLPAIEWQFSHNFTLENGNSYTITGTIDTILVDIDTDELIITDWKTRKDVTDERLVDLDGQLKLYAAIVNLKAGYPSVTRTMQYQVKNAVPRAAVLTEKTRQISLANISSTWEVWSESVRALGKDPEKYREQMEPKLHDPAFFTFPVITPISPISSRRAITNALQIGEAMRYAASADSYPGIPSSMGCQFCEFKNYCRVFDYGLPTSEVVALEYEQRTEDSDDDLF